RRDDFEKRAEREGVVSAYYIGTHDTILFWQARPIEPTEFNEFHRWSSAEYVERQIKDPSCTLYKSQAYIDYALNGPVRTTCRKLNNLGADNANAIAGVVCVDRALDPEEIVEKMQHRLTAYTEVEFRRLPGCRVLASDGASERHSVGAA